VSSRAMEEDKEILVQESRMWEHQSACKILSPLPTLVTLGEALGAVLGAITPCVTHIANEK
jgi:hypothetical protein